MAKWGGKDKDTDLNSDGKRTDVVWAGDLVKTGSGQCGAWVSFTAKLLKNQGLTTINGVKDSILEAVIFPKKDQKALAVNSWTTKGEGFPLEIPPWWKIISFDAGVDGSTPAVPGNGEAADAKGAAGQGNSPNPPSMFNSHRILLINGKYYDPSYGTGPIADKKSFEEAAFFGFISDLVLRAALLPPDCQWMEPAPPADK